MDKEELRERYEATGEKECYYEQAKPLYGAELKHSPATPACCGSTLRECHGRYAIRDAAVHYQRAIDAEPGQEKPHFQLFVALGALGDLDTVIPRYGQQVTARRRLSAGRRARQGSPDDPASLEVAPTTRH